MKIQFLLLAVAAFGSLQVEAFGSLPPYKPPPRTIPHCDSPAHTGKPGSRCYRNRYDVQEDFVGHMTDEDDDEYVGNAWNRGWLRHYCAGGPTPGKMAEWMRYCKMAAGADKMEEEDESVGGWVKVAGGLIWKDIDRGVANGECNGRCQRRLRAASRSRRLHFAWDIKEERRREKQTKKAQRKDRKERKDLVRIHGGCMDDFDCGYRKECIRPYWYGEKKGYCKIRLPLLPYLPPDALPLPY